MSLLKRWIPYVLFLSAALFSGSPLVLAETRHIESAVPEGKMVVIRGTTAIPPETSTYIQYYIGKYYPGTLTNCILSDGFHMGRDGIFELKLPVSALKGVGEYEIALEQNPNSDTILPPEHWVAFRKTDDGVVFGEISAMRETSNLALTVGMELAQGKFSVK